MNELEELKDEIEFLKGMIDEIEETLEEKKVELIEKQKELKKYPYYSISKSEMEDLLDYSYEEVEEIYKRKKYE